MKKIYFTCGPSQLYPKVNQYLKAAISNDIPSISHRGKMFQNLFAETVHNLKKLLTIPKNYHIFFLSSSLESMERVIENCVEKSSFHFVNGAFSRKFFQLAQELKRSPKKIEVDEGKGFDLNFARHSGKSRHGGTHPESNWDSGITTFSRMTNDIELIAITHNETSTGVSTSLQYNNIMEWRRRGTLIAVDAVSSAPYVKLDFSNIDFAFFSVQKEFGLPAGMGILIVSEKAIEKSEYLRKKGINTGSYHSFSSLVEKEKKFQTPETPNVLGIYLLNKVVTDMLKKGISTIRKETDLKAKLIYDFFDNHPKYKPFVRDKIFRSKTTIVIDVKGVAKKIIEKLKTKGMIVSSGYGKFKETHIRVANFPAHKIQNIRRLLDYLI